MRQQRRSDRIKVIATLKQHHKELEIAEKIRKRSEAQGALTSAQANYGDYDEEGGGGDELEGLQKNPFKIKDRWRRWSEKENETSAAASPSFMPSYSPSNSNNSPRSGAGGAYKKLLLDKVIFEKQISNEFSNSSGGGGAPDSFDYSAISGLYDHIDENVFVVTKRLATIYFIF
jgi:hypothetical protein